MFAACCCGWDSAFSWFSFWELLRKSWHLFFFKHFLAQPTYDYTKAKKPRVVLLLEIITWLRQMYRCARHVLHSAMGSSVKRYLLSAVYQVLDWAGGKSTHFIICPRSPRQRLSALLWLMGSKGLASKGEDGMASCGFRAMPRWDKNKGWHKDGEPS